MQLEEMGKPRRLKWWQKVLLTIAITALGGLSGRRSKKSERKLYNKELKQAPWAPPAWVFGPAWTAAGHPSNGSRTFEVAVVEQVADGYSTDINHITALLITD